MVNDKNTDTNKNISKSRETEMKKCVACSNISKLTCSNCNKVTYCTKECQKQHWKEHKNDCKPFTIATNKILGRYLIASKDIKQGELILKESAIVVGPSIESVPLCLNCYKQISPFKKPIFCLKCNVAPVCSVNCTATAEAGHTEKECAQFELNSYISAEKIVQHYQVVMPLRCLLLRKNKQEYWSEFIKMEAHLEERRNTPIWRNYKLNVESALHKFNVLSDDDLKDELVQKICGILDVNTFELRVPGFEANWQSGNNIECVRGVYLQAALIAHDCTGNTHLAVDDNFNMTIHASVPIAKNTPIYFNYTNALNGTFERQEHLKEGKYFNCTCRRCLDSTECNTHMSSIICVRCRKGLVSPVHTSEDVRKHNSIWKCSDKKCDYKCHGSMITSTVNCTKRLIEEADKTNLQSIELLFKKLLFTFPPTHSIILDLKQCLIGLYSEVLRTETNPSRKYLTRKMQLCMEILPILERVEPGISRLTGITLYEMHVPMIILANKEYDNGEISADDLLKQLLQAEEALKKAISFLLYEPTASPEGRLASRAMNELKLLRKNTSNVKLIVENKKQNVDKRRRKKK